MAPLRLPLCALAIAAGGCLDSPPAALSADAAPPGGPDGSPCPSTRDDFGGTALGGLWSTPEVQGASDESVSGGELRLSASPDAEVNGVVGITTLQDFDLGSSVLRVSFRATQSGDGVSGVGWFAAVDDFFVISNVGAAIRATYSVPLGSEEIVCAPCADYTADDRVEAEMREEDGQILFTATVGGEDWTLGSAPDSGRRYWVYFYAYQPLSSEGASTLDIDSVEWSDCEGAAAF